MDKELITHVLNEAGARPAKDGSYRLDPSQGATLFVDGGASAMLTLARVTCVAVKSGVAAVETDRGERFFVGLERIVALRLHSERESSGFVGR